jgi:hypothetical protein
METMKPYGILKRKVGIRGVFLDMGIMVIIIIMVMRCKRGNHNRITVKLMQIMGIIRREGGTINVNMGNNSHNDDKLIIGKSRLNLCEVNADQGNNKEIGGVTNIYVGQWDSIKEKMIWGVMETDKETFVKGSGFFKATFKGSSHVEGAISGNNMCKDALQASARGDEEARHEGPSDWYVANTCPAHVGEKRSGWVGEENTPSKSTVHGGKVVGSSGKRARREVQAIMKSGNDKAMAVSQPHLLQ